MGHTLKQLSKRELPQTAIFDRRFVIEVCEKIHFHYRNIRLNLSLTDWIELCQGCIKAFDRWQKRGNPEPGKKHIELCRRKVGTETYNDGIQINFNKNLYNLHKNDIYSAGASLEDEEYVHVKIRDIRIELTKQEFKVLAEAVNEAEEQLNATTCRV